MVLVISQSVPVHWSLCRYTAHSFSQQGFPLQKICLLLDLLVVVLLIQVYHFNKVLAACWLRGGYGVGGRWQVLVKERNRNSPGVVPTASREVKFPNCKACALFSPDRVSSDPHQRPSEAVSLMPLISVSRAIAMPTRTAIQPHQLSIDLFEPLLSTLWMRLNPGYRTSLMR